MEEIIIIGAGAAGLCAAWELAKNHVHSVLVSDMPSERAQSNMAEGGINAAFYRIQIRRNSTQKKRCELVGIWQMLRQFTTLLENAPNIIEQLFSAGMSFSLNSDGKPDVRAFGGQSVKRTFYVASNTGKQLMHTLIDQVRRYECTGLVRRMTGYLFLRLLRKREQVCGCVFVHANTGKEITFHGKVIVASVA